MLIPKCEVYKYVQMASGTVDDLETYYGDVYYVIDSTNKTVNFYILCGQYASSQFTPFTKIGSTTTSGITQYSGTATYYSSGTKVWATRNGTTYARLSHITTKTSQLTNDSGFINKDVNNLTNYLPLTGGNLTGLVTTTSSFDILNSAGDTKLGSIGAFNNNYVGIDATSGIALGKNGYNKKWFIIIGDDGSLTFQQ